MARYVIEPKIKGFICTTAHPLGCESAVRRQIDYVLGQPTIANGPRHVLVLGGSTGYGLASRIVAAFGARARTTAVFFERAAQGDRTASAGWYNSVTFEKFARSAGLRTLSINGDAFSDEIKAETVNAIGRADMGPIDLVIYSLAAPRRTDPKTGETFRSVLKPIGHAFEGKTVNTDRGTVSDVIIEPASKEEIESTVSVMGGADWELWIDALLQAKLLAPGAVTVNYSYIGPELTWPIYRDGTIGRAKADIARSVAKINGWLQPIGGRALISVNKAVVTQASSAIPVVPLYISLLLKVLREKNLQEDCIEQMYRLFAQQLYGSASPADPMIRLDDREMRQDVQDEISRIWPELRTENLMALTDFADYQKNFLRLFGFGLPDVDYGEAVETVLNFEEKL